MRMKHETVEGECAVSQCHKPSTIVLTISDRVELCDAHWKERCAVQERSYIAQQLAHVIDDPIIFDHITQIVGG